MDAEVSSHSAYSCSWWNSAGLSFSQWNRFIITPAAAADICRWHGNAAASSSSSSSSSRQHYRYLPTTFITVTSACIRCPPDRHNYNSVIQIRPHSIILASCKPGCKPGFPPGLQPGFQHVCAGLRHAFDFFCWKPGREPAAKISTCRDWCSRFAAGSLVRARARQMKCRKQTRFEPANEPVKARFSLCILLFVLIVT